MTTVAVPPPTGATRFSSPDADGDATMPPEQPHQENPNGAQEPDWYFENGLLVYTATYHLNRGYCCGSGCRHCPYEPRHVEGATEVRP